MKSITRPSLYAAALGTLWVFLAWRSPTITYHLAPLLVAAVIPLALTASERAGIRVSAIGSLVGGSLAIGATLILGVSNHLQGPSLLPTGGAVLEAGVFAAIGALGGAAVATLRR